MAISYHVTGSPTIPPYEHPLWQHWRECGWANVRPHSMGPLWPMLFALGNPLQVYEASAKMTTRGSRTMTAKLIRSTSDECTVRFTLEPGFQDWSAACWSRIGFLEGVPTIWGLPLARVEHPVCIHDSACPGQYCEYVVHFTPRSRHRWQRLAAMTGGGAALGLATGALISDAPALCGALGLMSGAMIDGWLRYLQQLSHSREDASRLSEQLDIADHRYRDLVRERQNLTHALLLNRKIAGYVTRDVLEDLVANPEGDIELGGVRTDAAVLFVDLVGFTARCETESPELVVGVLNRFFATVDPIVHSNGGVIDKRLGDGVMAVFASRTAAIDADTLRRSAVRCGLEVLAAVAEIPDTHRTSGHLQVHAGLAAGSLVQGNMGSDVKLEYTVIGDVVNLASRLQHAAEPDELVMDADCWQAARDLVPIAEQCDLHVKGRARTVAVVRARIATWKSGASAAASATSHNPV